MASPDNPDAIFKMAEAKAGHWAGEATSSQQVRVPANAARADRTDKGKDKDKNNHKRKTNNGKGKDQQAWIPCSFYLSGYCRWGNNCKFYHTSNDPGTPLAKDVCRICHHPGHWVNE